MVATWIGRAGDDRRVGLPRRASGASSASPSTCWPAWRLATWPCWRCARCCIPAPARTLASGPGGQTPAAGGRCVLVLAMAGAPGCRGRSWRCRWRVLVAGDCRVRAGRRRGRHAHAAAGAALLRPAWEPAAGRTGLISLAITVLVLVGLPARRAARPNAGRAQPGPDAGCCWAGIGGWLGFLLVSRLSLLVDRLAFLLNGWLGIGR